MQKPPTAAPVAMGITRLDDDEDGAMVGVLGGEGEMIVKDTADTPEIPN